VNHELPESLRSLIAAESGAPVLPDNAHASVRAKLGVTLGLAAGATAAVTAATSSSATAATTTAATTTAAATTAATTTVAATSIFKIGAVAKILVVAVGLGTATTVGIATQSSRSSNAQYEMRASTLEVAPPSRELDVGPSPVAAREVAPPLVDTPADTDEPTREAVAPRPPRARADSPESPPTSAPVSSVAQPPAQAQLLADATRAFSNREHARALQLLDDDERLHPGGPLSEERDALRVSVLVASGRAADARIRARELLARYPHTIHRASLERVMEKEKDAP
jgi:hypothetical protein